MREEGGVPGWTVRQGGAVVGHVGSTWEIAGSVGYSGRPLDVLVAVSPDARITGALLVAHNEPVLTLGISDADIAAYVSGFAGYDLTAATPQTKQAALPDVISRATVSTGVIRDGILRSARTLALARGLMAGDGGIDRISFAQTDLGRASGHGGAVRGAGQHGSGRRRSGRGQGAADPGPGDFLQIWAGVIDPPTIGRSLLGQQDFTRAIGNLPPGGRF
jgi:NosR/NirI family nitrite reductase transcriptional regulator